MHIYPLNLCPKSQRPTYTIQKSYYIKPRAYTLDLAGTPEPLMAIKEPLADLLTCINFNLTRKFQNITLNRCKT